MPDKHEPNFVYTSKRLLTDLYTEHISAKRGTVLDHLNVWLVGAGGRLSTPQPDNEYWLARQVTEIVKDNTGTLLYPGKYVKCNLVTTRAAIPYNEEQTTVAWLEAEASTEEGPVFVALCGSRANLRGAIPDNLYGGWFPSSAAGFTNIVRAFGRGNNDPRKFLSADDTELPDMFQTMYKVARSPTATYRIATERLEILFEVFYSYDNLSIANAPCPYFRRLYFGTPLWAAAPEPRPLPHS